MWTARLNDYVLSLKAIFDVSLLDDLSLQSDYWSYVSSRAIRDQLLVREVQIECD